MLTGTFADAPELGFVGSTIFDGVEAMDAIEGLSDPGFLTLRARWIVIATSFFPRGPYIPFM